jgi:hypothetical protein
MLSMFVRENCVVCIGQQFASSAQSTELPSYDCKCTWSLTTMLLKWKLHIMCQNQNIVMLMISLFVSLCFKFNCRIFCYNLELHTYLYFLASFGLWLRLTYVPLKEEMWVHSRPDCFWGSLVSYPVGTGALSPELKRPRLEANHAPPSNVKVNTCSLPPLIIRISSYSGT